MMFEKILFSLVAVTGLVILFYRLMLPKVAQQPQAPWPLDWSRSFFPVLLFVFALRGFVVEPFKIPSGSMLPTLEIGDFILVNKYTYGIRLPLLYTKVIDINEPQRGDIVVFRYPKDNRTSYIKRLIGLPGDRVTIKGRGVFINGELVHTLPEPAYTPDQSFAHEQQAQFLPRGDDFAKFSTLYSAPRFSARLNQSLTVPAGHYFMMGDNRDNSSDSRSWGPVPERNIVGKAFYIWMHYDPRDQGGFDFSRVGTPIQAEIVQSKGANASSGAVSAPE